MPPSLIEVESIRKEYPMPGGAVQALRSVTLAFEAGELVSIVGASGSGKSTLLYLLGLLVTPTEGVYRYGGREVQALSDAERSRLRGRQIGFIFQSFHLVPQLSVLQNVLLSARYAGNGNGKTGGRARELLERVGLAKRLTHRPAELSSGEMQRTAIARALLMDPQVILADEPTGNLDEKTGAEVIALLEEFHQEGKTVIIVTHNLKLAERTRRKITIANGEVAS